MNFHMYERERKRSALRLRIRGKDKTAQSEEKVMKAYKNLSKAELETLQKELQAKYDTIKASGISLDMSRFIFSASRFSIDF